MSIEFKPKEEEVEVDQVKIKEIAHKFLDEVLSEGPNVLELVIFHLCDIVPAIVIRNISASAAMNVIDSKEADMTIDKIIESVKINIEQTTRRFYSELLTLVKEKEGSDEVKPVTPTKESK